MEHLQNISKYVPHTQSKIEINNKQYTFYNINSLHSLGFNSIEELPYSIKVLLEAAIRQFDGTSITDEHIEKLAKWSENGNQNQEVPFKPARILLHDTTGLPLLVDLAAMREAVSRHGGDPSIVNPTIPVDLVVDHSVTVEQFGSLQALHANEKIEFERNYERFRFLRWAQNAFKNVNIVPPSSGIMHQINMELLSSVIKTKETNGSTFIYPDTLVGTDSHTTMINGLSIVAWGVGGIEAEAAMLDQPLYFVPPKVVGFKVTGSLPEGTTSTDLALTITNLLRKHGVVGKFVEFYGPGVKNMSVVERATIANMAPEYGATMGFFPVDEETLNYLRSIGRSEDQITLIESYYKTQGMFMTSHAPDPKYTEIVELDLSTVVPCLAGPKRPQDRIELTDMKKAYQEIISSPVDRGGYALEPDALDKEIEITHKSGEKAKLKHGSVVLAAITSCTNTSNPTVLIGAGLLAKKAVEKGLKKQSFVKSSLTPGSRVVADYLGHSGLLTYLENLGFHIAGYGCATCIGNSGPLPEEISNAITQEDLVTASVLSGNRNFEGRVHPQLKANYLASPPLVVVYALAGTVNIDFEKDPIGIGTDNHPVLLRDIWPSSEEIQAYINKYIHPELFKKRYETVYDANDQWNKIESTDGQLYQWDKNSTYIQEPPFLKKLSVQEGGIQDFRAVRVLAMLGDSVTTDHASPSGAIKPDSPAGLYLLRKGVERKDFNSYPSRRGNHKIMMRGAFANVRIRNKLVNGIEGGFTLHHTSGQVMSIYEAAMKYKEENTNLLIVAGKEYGTGSSRDWAAKGPHLLGVKMILAESFERIHRSNLVGMGVLPLQFMNGETAATLGITGHEAFETIGLSECLQPGEKIQIRATREDGRHFTFDVLVRLDNIVEIGYYKNGGIMQSTVKKLLNGATV